MINGFTHADLGPIWYHSEHSDIPYFPHQFLGWDFFATLIFNVFFLIIDTKGFEKFPLLRKVFTFACICFSSLLMKWHIQELAITCSSLDFRSHLMFEVSDFS